MQKDQRAPSQPQVIVTRQAQALKRANRSANASYHNDKGLKDATRAKKMR